MSVWQESRQQDAIENLRIVAEWVRDSAGIGAEMVLGLVPGWCWDWCRDGAGIGPGLVRDWGGTGAGLVRDASLSDPQQIPSEMSASNKTAI
jgi:hypothetical protein